MKSNPILKDLNRHVVNHAWAIPRQEYIHRLYYVNSGSADILFGDKEFTLTAGNFYLFAPSNVYERLSADSFDYTHFSFYTTPALQNDQLLEINSSVGDMDKLICVVNTMLQENTMTTQNSLYFLKIFLSILEHHFSLPFIEDSTIIRALDIINQNAYNVTVKTLSQQLHISESYFIHLFTGTMGCSPMKYIRRVRLSDVENMLKKGMRVSEVAEKCGYASSTALWKAIRKNYGCTPSELKKK